MTKKRDFIITSRVGDEKTGKEIRFLMPRRLANGKCGGCILVCLAGYVDLNGFSVLLSVNEQLFERRSEARKSIVIIFILNRLFKVLKGSNTYIDLYRSVLIPAKANAGIKNEVYYDSLSRISLAFSIQGKTA